MQVSPTRAPSTGKVAGQLVAFFRYAATCSDTDFMEAVLEHDLSLGQIKTLSLLHEASEPLSVKELAERLGISLPSASRALDPLVRRRLVARKEDTDDRRVKRVALTARGRTLAERLIAARVSSFKSMLAEFDEDELRKLADALDAVLARPEIAHFHAPKQRSAG